MKVLFINFQSQIISTIIHRVAVTGIYRATPLRVTRRQRAVKAVYRTYVNVVHFRKTDTRRLRGREEEEEEENG